MNNRPVNEIDWVWIETKQTSCGVQLRDGRIAQTSPYYRHLLGKTFNDIEKMVESDPSGSMKIYYKRGTNFKKKKNGEEGKN